MSQHIFVCGLFYGAAHSSDFTASNIT